MRMEQQRYATSADAIKRRRQAEAYVRIGEVESVSALAEDSVRRLLHELQVHQIELELRVTDLSVELARANKQLTQEVENRKQLEEKLLDSQLSLRYLYANLQTVREEERKSIAREIHDELGQLLATIQMGVSLLAGELSADPSLGARTKDITALIADAIRTVQRISSELRPVMLDNLGLGDALEWHGREFSEKAGIDCNLSVHVYKNVAPPDVATAIFRIFQESLTNVQRHSGATKVEARLLERRHHYSLTVRDNGRGITAEEIRSPQSIGLIGIRERLYLLGGRMRVIGSPGHGTVLLVRMPIKPKGNMHVRKHTPV
jgi:signal transduction histidine kinase